jgi:5'-nucleotidase
MTTRAAPRQPLRAFVRLLAAVAVLGPFAGAFGAEPIPLRLIGINDFHGNLEATGLNLQLADPQDAARSVRVPVGGAAALAGLVKALRDTAPNSLMLSGGDLIGAAPLVSALYRHETTVDIMNAIGLDASTVGNHEFDNGAAELRRVKKGGCAKNAPDVPTVSCAQGEYAGAKFDYLSSNVVDAKGHTLFPASVIKNVHGIRVGIIGAVTRATPNLVVPSGVAGLRFLDEAASVNRAARRLQARGVDVIVLAIHEGGEIGPPNQRGDWNDASCPQRQGPIFEIARHLTRDVGVIFSAHTHQGYRCVVDGRVIIQGTSYGRGMSVVDLALDPKTRRIIPSLTHSINLPVLNDQTDPALRERLAAALPAPYAEILRTQRPDAEIAARVAGLAALVAPTAQRVIGVIGGRFARGGPVDSPAGRLIADAQLAATRGADRGGAQIAFMNPGGIRSDLDCNGTPPCNVSFGQVFTMQPFGNSLVVMTLTGIQLKALLESQQKAAGSEATMLQPSEGFTYAWQSDAPPGARVHDMRLNGVPIFPGQGYRVTVNSFLAEGGDGFVLLKQGTARLGGAQDLDALIAHLQAPGGRAPVVQPRVTRLP